MEMWQVDNAVVQFYWNIQTGEKLFKRSQALVLQRHWTLPLIMSFGNALNNKMGNVSRLEHGKQWRKQKWKMKMEAEDWEATKRTI